MSSNTAGPGGIGRSGPGSTSPSRGLAGPGSPFGRARILEIDGLLAAAGADDPRRIPARPPLPRTSDPTEALSCKHGGVAFDHPLPSLCRRVALFDAGRAEDELDGLEEGK